MTTISISTARRSRYINRSIYELKDERHSNAPTWKAAPGFEALVDQFIRNKVLIQFTTAFFTAEDEDLYDDGDIKELVGDIHEYCDMNCTGLWTLHKRYHRNKDFDQKTNTWIRYDTGRGDVTVHFEMPDDADKFIKECKVVNP